MKMIESPRQYVYPAVFTPARDESGLWRVRFPDLAKGGQVNAYTLEEAMLCAYGILKAHVLHLEQNKYPAPAPTPCGNVSIEDGDIVQLVVASPDNGDSGKDRNQGGSAASRVKTFLVVVLFICLLAAASLSSSSSKPVIYLYPETVTEVSVRLDYNGALSHTWPPYEDGWKVTARPDGTLVNHADGREYSYLFWEGETEVPFDFSSGFVVKGSETGEFLREKLAFMGLTPREYNEFIVYWLPLMEGNAYNLISFQGAAYTDNAVLTVEPQPDSVLRVYMTFKALSSPTTVPPQELKPFERKGFTLVEWGGGEVKN
ncbi:MAG: hypothetical protein LBQ42_08180 [Synergistaceae bacterium]|jgi:predicted RNase H-like HicB family nuclease|nr:hypothetical protein [Synergistaceae bacterium]